MSALENMVRTVLKAMDLDADAVKEQVTSRIKAFEENLATLNATLTAFENRLSNIEKNFETLMTHYGLEYQPTTKGKPNGTDNRGTVPTIEGPKAGA